NGVVVVDDRADYVIRTIAATTKTVSGVSNGFAVSVVVSRPFDVDLLKDMFSPEYKTADIKTALSDLEWIETTQILLGGSQDLRQVIERAVASFDGEILEPTRRFQEGLRNLIKKQQK